MKQLPRACACPSVWYRTSVSFAPACPPDFELMNTMSGTSGSSGARNFFVLARYGMGILQHPLAGLSGPALLLHCYSVALNHMQDSSWMRVACSRLLPETPSPVGLPQVCEGSVHCIFRRIHGASLHLGQNSVR